MTDPIKLAIEEEIRAALHDAFGPLVNYQSYEGQWFADGYRRGAALRSIKPPCQMCMHYWPRRDDMEHFCGRLGCINYDKFTPLEPICLTEEK